MKSIRTDPRNHAAEGDERIRTAVCEPSTDPAYEYGLSLTCGHRQVLGHTATIDAGQSCLDALPVRADGWYAAHKCWACGMRRAVACGFVHLTSFGAASHRAGAGS